MMMNQLPRLAFLPVDCLIIHEWHDKQRTPPLIQRLKASGIFRNPPVVCPLPDETERYMVLDGANRTTALQHLGYPHVLVQVVPYSNPPVTLSTWHHLLCGLEIDDYLACLRDLERLEMVAMDLLHARPLRRAAGVVLADDGPNHRVRNTHFGVSGGNVNDISKRFCCSGTLGSLVTDGSVHYILSNNHVLGRSDQATAGDYVSQPGLIDNRCQVAAVVADFTVAAPLGSNVDAAIAALRTGQMDASGYIEDIGKISAWATRDLVPDLTVLLDVRPEDGLSRLGGPADRIESESVEFHTRVRKGFRTLAEQAPDRYLVLDAREPQEKITREIQRRIRPLLPDPVDSSSEAVTGMIPVIRPE